MHLWCRIHIEYFLGLKPFRFSTPRHVRPHPLLVLPLIRQYSKKPDTNKMVRILNVAEKNDASKSLADIMSRGGFRKREGFSKFNKIYEFDYMLHNRQTTMTMTSVSGHLLGFEFVGQYRKWLGCNPVALFEAPVQKICSDNFIDIKRTLEREIRGCQKLIIWTDCDREGENIGMEIVQVCQQVKPNIEVLRARFSEITPQAVERALNNLQPPDINSSNAVDVRSELDLRIGAAFTRFQTLRLKKVFPDVLAEQLISYGSCQFPTLGFVVERYKQVEAFIREPFWKLKVTHERDDACVDFTWKRVRLFNHAACLALYEHCLEAPEAKVLDVKSKPKSKWRPVALDTVEMEKLSSRKLRIGAKETMKIAEKLYTRGFISYPRTETNMFSKEFDLAGLVQMQTQDPHWGAFANRVVQRGPTPRNGTKTDKAHPPIHPIKYTNTLQGNEQKVYEFIVRHFLACCSEDAKGQETIVDIDINDEKFSASGLMILERNYLDVYPYDKWNTKIIPTYHTGEVFQPSCLEMAEGETGPPPLLSEADLIALMDKHGIGTDATHAEHIETIKSRMYVGVRDDGRLLPGELGMGLVEGYDAMGFEMSKPHLRAGLEADLQRICDGIKDGNDVLQEQVQKYKHVFEAAVEQATKIDQALSEYFGAAQQYQGEEYHSTTPVYKCNKCGCDVAIKQKKDGSGYFLSCSGYPNCREVIWLPNFVLSAEVSDTNCDQCSPPRKKIKFKFKKGSVPLYLPLVYESCIGCDNELKEILEVGGRGAGPSQSGSQAPRDKKTTRVVPTQSRSYSTSSQSGFRSPLTQTHNVPGVMATNTGSSQGTENRRPRGGSTRGMSSRGSGARGGGPGYSQGSARGGAQGPGYGASGHPSNGGGDEEARSGGPSPGGDAGAVVCNCGEDGKLLTVRKEGANTGRQFYSCSRPQESRCGFFLWADSGPSDGAQPSQNNNPQGNSWATPGQSRTPQNNWTGSAATDDSKVIECNCGHPAKSLKVNKEGQNKGRPFFACPNPMGKTCGFFKWGDEPDGDNAGGSDGGWGTSGGWPSRGRGSSVSRGNRGGSKSRGSSSSSGGQKRKRHCGHCGEEGHTKKTCPQLK